GRDVRGDRRGRRLLRGGDLDGPRRGVAEPVRAARGDHVRGRGVGRGPAGGVRRARAGGRRAGRRPPGRRHAPGDARRVGPGGGDVRVPPHGGQRRSDGADDACALTMTKRMTRKTLRSVALALALAAGAGVTPLARAQDLPLPGEGFTWERVGDRPIEADDLAFTDDGTLWAASADGPCHHALTDGFPGRWVLIDEPSLHGATLPLGPDTLVGNTGASTRRSLDGGATWEEVYDGAGDEGLYEVPGGHPFAGRVLKIGRAHV